MKVVFAALRRFARDSNREKMNVGAIVIGIFASVGEWIYHMISFFTLPGIIIRKKRTYGAMKESAELFKRNLWDVILADTGYGFGAFIMYLMTGAILGVGGYAYGYFVGAANGLGTPVFSGVVVAIFALLFGFAITKFFIRPLYTSFVTTIYVYASEGPAGLSKVSKKLQSHIETSLKSPRALPRNKR